VANAGVRRLARRRPCNRSIGEQSAQVAATVLAGEVFVEGPRGGPRVDWETMLQVVLAQEDDHLPVTVAEWNPFCVGQRL
jgi:hypothetical protein